MMTDYRRLYDETLQREMNSRRQAGTAVPETREPREQARSGEAPVAAAAPAYGSLVSVPWFPCLGDPRQSAFTDAAVERLQRRWEASDDGSFNCPIPEHAGRSTLALDEDGGYVLDCCRGRQRSLAEVRAARAYGIDRLRSNIELAIWWRRLAHELGTFEPAPVEVPDVWAGALANVRAARDGFALLLGLRRADYPDRPVPFSARFAAAWCGLSKDEANRAIRDLLARSVIVEVDRQGRIRLYEPGSRSKVEPWTSTAGEGSG